MVLLRHTTSTMCHRIIFKLCEKKHLSADVGPHETNIINRSKCNMPVYIIIGDYITKIEILFT